MYDPANDRRGDDRPPDAMRGLWFRGLRPSEILAGFVIAGLIASMLGLRFTSISKLDERVAAIEKQEVMRDFILCALIRETNPALTPPDCVPIINAKERKP